MGTGVAWFGAVSSDVHRIYNVVVVLGLELVANGCSGEAVSSAQGMGETSVGGAATTTGATTASTTTTTGSSASTTSATSGAGGMGTSNGSTDGITLSTSTTGSSTDGAAGAPPEAEDPPCPATQWSCEYPRCYAPTYQATGACSCDLERPTSEDDCRADEYFVCNQYDTAAGIVPFSCQCVPTSTPCSSVCNTLDQWTASSLSRVTPDCSTRSLLCDCAYPVILK